MAPYKLSSCRAIDPDPGKGRGSQSTDPIANADVVARDGNGVGRSHLAGGDGLAAGERRRTDGRTVGGSGSRSWGGSAGSWGRSAGSGDVSLAEVGRGRGGRRSRGGSRSSVFLLNNDVLADVLVVGRLGGVVVRVVVAVTVDGVSDVVGYFRSCLGDTVTKRVVLAVVVVISHITLVRFGGVNSGTSSLYSNLLAMRVAAVNGFYLTTGRVAVVLDVKGLSVIARSLVVVGLGVEVAALSNGSSDDGTSTLAELTLGDVNLGSSVVGLRRTLDSVEVAIVGALRCFEMATDDRTLGLIAVLRVAVLVDVNLYALGATDVFGLGTGLGRLLVVVLLVDADFLAVLLLGMRLLLLEVLLGLLWATLAVLEDTDVLGVGLAELGGTLGRLVDADREGFLMFRVTFPSCLW
jgi:hypothetical protein